jgi:hypothetical protein
MRWTFRLPRSTHDADRLRIRLIHDQERVPWEKQNGALGEIYASMPLARHPSQRREQFVELVFDAVSQFHAVICNTAPDFKKVAASSPPLTEPCRLASFHVGLRFLGRDEFTAVKLPERPLDFSGYFGLVAKEPLLFGVQYSQSPLDDFIRALVSARLHRLGDQFLILRSKRNRHARPPAIVAISASTVDVGAGAPGG